MKPLYSTLHHIHTCGESNEIICLGHRLLLCGKKAKGSFSQLGFLSVRLVAAAANREGSGCYKGSHYCWKQELSSISSSQHPFCSQQKFHFFFFLPSPFSPTVPYPTSSFLHTLFTLTAGVACTWPSLPRTAKFCFVAIVTATRLKSALRRAASSKKTQAEIPSLPRTS